MRRGENQTGRDDAPRPTRTPVEPCPPQRTGDRRQHHQAEQQFLIDAGTTVSDQSADHTGRHRPTAGTDKGVGQRSKQCSLQMRQPNRTSANSIDSNNMVVSTPPWSDQRSWRVWCHASRIPQVRTGQQEILAESNAFKQMPQPRIRSIAQRDEGPTRRCRIHRRRATAPQMPD